jgi:hypothetical protein
MGAEQIVVRVHRERRRAQHRRQPGEAAAGADVAAGAADDLGLHAQVVLRREAAGDADDARHVAKQIVLVIVDRQAGVERHHRQARRDALHDRPQRRPVGGRIGERGPGVELHRHERVGKRRQRHRRRRDGRVAHVVLHVLQRLVAQPELPQQPEHRRRMADHGRAKIGAPTDAGEDRLIEGRKRRLLLVAVGMTRGVQLGELARGKEIQELDIVVGDVAVPPGHAAARDDHEPRSIDAIAVAEPAQERHPIEHLVADFPEPRADDDRLRAARDTLQLAPHLQLAFDPRPRLLLHAA